MAQLPPLAALGPRILVCGPSNAGKSTLAIALGRRLDVAIIHLDLLYHLPDTDWKPRPKAEFERLHAAALAGESWVIDGNYFGTLGPRLARATGIILLGDTRWANFRRYLGRTLLQRETRPGALAGGKDSLKWDMVHFILIEQPKKRERDLGLLRAAGLPMVVLSSMAELNRLYADWRLDR